jgi:phosphonate transport system substrate-binding protein
MLAVLAVFASHVMAQEAGSRFRVGVVTAGREDARSEAEPFRDELEYRLGLPADLFLMDTLGELTDALIAGHVQYGRLSASAYAAAQKACGCVEPLAAPRDGDGADGFHAVVLAKAAQTPSLESLAGKRLAIGPARSTAAFRVPLAGLAASGRDPRQFFSALVPVTGPEDGLLALYDGTVEASLGWSTLLSDAESGYSAGTLLQAYDRMRLDVGRLTVVWQSPRIPFAVHVVRSDVAPELKDRLRQMLSALQDEAPGAYFAIEPDFGGGFVPVLPEDFSAVTLPLEPQWQAMLKEIAEQQSAVPAPLPEDGGAEDLPPP